MTFKPTVVLHLSMAIALGACGKSGDTGPQTPSSTASASASAAGTATATATASAAAPEPPPKAPAWLSTVTSKPVTAKVGDRVWDVSAYPNSENVAFGVAEVDSVQGNTATIASLMRVGGRLTKDNQYAPRRPFAPELFLRPARGVEQVKPKPKEWVIAPMFGFTTTVGQVVSVDGKLATVKYAHNDKVSEEPTEYLEPLQTGVTPFAFGAVKRGAKTIEVIIYQLDGDVVFGVDDQGNLVRAAKSDVKALKVDAKDRKVGSKVTVFDSSAGAVETTIDRVVEAKWIYEVKVNGSTKKAPFHTVFDKL